MLSSYFTTLWAEVELELECECASYFQQERRLLQARDMIRATCHSTWYIAMLTHDGAIGRRETLPEAGVQGRGAQTRGQSGHIIPIHPHGTVC